MDDDICCFCECLFQCIHGSAIAYKESRQAVKLLKATNFTFDLSIVTFLGITPDSDFSVVFMGLSTFAIALAPGKSLPTSDVSRA
jgi:hypothetical protein